MTPEEQTLFRLLMGRDPKPDETIEIVEPVRDQANDLFKRQNDLIGTAKES